MKQQKGKVIVFPGLIEKLLREAQQLMDANNFNEAASLLEQLFTYKEPSEQLLNMYVHCLLFAKRYADAKEACEQLMQLNEVNPFEILEIYVTICVQLKDFYQVKKVIETMQADQIIPYNQIEQFEQLLALSKNVTERKVLPEQTEQEVNREEWFEANTFVRLPKNEQLIILQELEERNIRPLINDLCVIIQHPKTHPFIKSLILILFVEQQVDVVVKFEKLGQTFDIQTAKLQLPTQLPNFEQLCVRINEMYHQEPTMLELLNYTLSKHAIVMYPADFTQFELQRFIDGYREFGDALFSEVRATDEPMQQFLNTLEKLSELED